MATVIESRELAESIRNQWTAPGLHPESSAYRRQATVYQVYRRVSVDHGSHDATDRPRMVAWSSPGLMILIGAVL